jgi:hypothetical protein
MPLVEAAPFDSAERPASSFRDALLGALFQPKLLFGQLKPGPVAPALKLAAFNLAFPAAAAILTDDTLWLGRAGSVIGRGVGMWALGVAWLIWPQAFLFGLVMRVFGAKQPLSLAQRGMGAFSALLAVFGVALSIAGTNPESAPFVISWYLALSGVTLLGTYALYRLAEGAYGLRAGKAVGAVMVFELAHSIALMITLGVLFTIIGS